MQDGAQKHCADHMSVIFLLTETLLPVATAALQAEQEGDGVIVVRCQRVNHYLIYVQLCADDKEKETQTTEQHDSNDIVQEKSNAKPMTMTDKRK
jgi:hypothetical protein